MRISSRVVLLAAIALGIAVAIYPPYADSHGYSRGYSIIGSPPSRPEWKPNRFGPVVLPDGTVIKDTPPPPEPPAHVDWATVLRCEVTVLLVGWALVSLLQAHTPKPAKSIAIACLVGLVLPIPLPWFPPFFIPGPAMMPNDFYTDTNHGISGSVFAGVMYMAYVFWIYGGLLAWAAGRRWLQRRSVAEGH